MDDQIIKLVPIQNVLIVNQLQDVSNKLAPQTEAERIMLTDEPINWGLMGKHQKWLQQRSIAQKLIEQAIAVLSMPIEESKKLGLGIKIKIGDGWMWYCGHELGTAIVGGLKDSLLVVPADYEMICEQLKSEGYSIELGLRQE